MAVKNSKNRRSFLKYSGLLAGGILVSSGLKSFSALVYATEEKPGATHWYGMAIDIKKCIGCGRCVNACKIENDVPLEPFFFLPYLNLIWNWLLYFSTRL